jgi:hypothetical protein
MKHLLKAVPVPPHWLHLLVLVQAAAASALYACFNLALPCSAVHATLRSCIAALQIAGISRCVRCALSCDHSDASGSSKAVLLHVHPCACVFQYQYLSLFETDSDSRQMSATWAVTLDIASSQHIPVHWSGPLRRDDCHPG